MDEGIALTASNLTKSYKLYDSQFDRVKEAFHPLRKSFHHGFDALHDVSFFVRKGETIGIIGKNGSGKSTLLQILCGIIRPSSGGYRVNGRLSALLELGAGFNPEFTGVENVYLNGSIMGFSKKEMDARLGEILDFADIGDFVYQPVKTYSSGMAVRLAFAIYAITDPDVFIVDEALAVGDAFFVHRCMLRFHDMQQRGKTIILVTHDPSAVKKLCHRAIWLDSGRLQMIGNSTEVVDRYLESLFKQKTAEYRPEAKTAPDNDAAENETGKEDKSKQLLPETSIPNCDRRLGDGKLSIVGVKLYDESLTPISAIGHNRTVILRMTIQNNSLEEDRPIVAGYIFRDSRGIEIASCNTKMVGTALPRIPLGESLTVQMKIIIPMLYPGSYSLSPSVSHIVNDQHEISDRLLNAVVLEIVTGAEMHVLLRFATEVEVEG